MCASPAVEASRETQLRSSYARLASRTAIAVVAVLLSAPWAAPEERARARAVGLCRRSGRRRRQHAAPGAEHLPAAGRLLADEAGARRPHPHRGRCRGGLVFRRGTGGAVD